MRPLQPAQDDYAAYVKDSFARQRVMRLFGAKLISVDPGKVDIELVANPELSQQNGFLHAGVTTTIADSAGGYAALSLCQKGENVLTTEIKLNFLAPADGNRFVATGRVIKSGRTLSVCQIEVHVFKNDKSVTLCAYGVMSVMRVAA